jgi:hypothetical protein
VLDFHDIEVSVYLDVLLLSMRKYVEFQLKHAHILLLSKGCGVSPARSLDSPILVQPRGMAAILASLPDQRALMPSRSCIRSQTFG